VNKQFQLKRPFPPDELEPWGDNFVPSFTMSAWIKSSFLNDKSGLYNPEHSHLRSANIGVLWTNADCSRQGIIVVGMAEIPRPPTSANAWHKARFNFQLKEWFGRIPDFLLTFDARYSMKCDDLGFCSLVEHELYHCAQARNEYNCPKYRKDGTPVFTIRGHDVEEFVGIVQRYGAGAGAGRTMELVAAAAKRPQIGAAKIRAACGTCNLKLA
jgi:hypothetical protein